MKDLVSDFLTPLRSAGKRIEDSLQLPILWVHDKRDTIASYKAARTRYRSLKDEFPLCFRESSEWYLMTSDDNFYAHYLAGSAFSKGTDPALVHRITKFFQRRLWVGTAGGNSG